MNELVKTIVSQLNINESQAQGALGSVMGMAQKFLGNDFSKISQALPGIEAMIANSPKTQSSGLGGVIGGVMSALGQSDSGLANLNTLVGQFKSLGLDAGTVTKFLPVVIEFLQKNGNPQVAELLQKAMAQFKA